MAAYLSNPLCPRLAIQSGFPSVSPASRGVTVGWELAHDLSSVSFVFPLLRFFVLLNFVILCLLSI